MAQCPCPSAGVGAQAAAAKAAAKLGESPSVAQTHPSPQQGAPSPRSLPPCQPRQCWLCPRVPVSRTADRAVPAAGAGVLPGVGGIPGVAPGVGVGVGGVPGVGGEVVRGPCPGPRGGSPSLTHSPDSLPLSRQSEARQRRQQRRRQRQRRELLVSSCCLGQVSAQGRAVHRCQGLCGSTAAPAAPIPSSGYSPCPLSRPSSFSSRDEGLTGPSGCSSLA